MNNWLLLLIGLLIYSIIGTALHYRNRLPPGLSIHGPITTYRSQRGIDWIDRTASRYPETWHRYGTLGAIAAGIVLVLSALLVLSSALFTIFYPQPESSINEPVNMLIVPVVNDFLPLSTTPHIVAGLVIGLVIHEGGHAIMCRIGDISIDSVGTISLAAIPLGAFVEPDEESVTTASRPAKLRMYAAGVMNNFVLSFVLLLILLIPVLGAFSVAPGAAIGGVVDNSPAADATLENGDRITSINGTPIMNNTQYQSYLSSSNQKTLSVSTADGKTLTLHREVTVRSAAKDAAFTPGTTITHINGTTINTSQDFSAELTNKRVATIQTAIGDTKIIPVGRLVKAQPGLPAATAGVPTDTTVTITAVNGTLVSSSGGLSSVLSTHSSGETVSVEVYENNKFNTYSITLTDRNGEASLGVSTAPGISGLVVDDDGVQLYPAEHYLGLLKHGQTEGNVIGNSIFGHLLLLLQLPAAGAAGVLTYNFAGFTGGVENFYTITGPLSVFGAGAVMGFANMLFWVSWVNINLGIFNCIPTPPLDGGHIVRELYGYVTEKLPVTPALQHTIARVAAYATAALMLGSIFVMLFAV